jgi:hypothetical protein
MQAWSKAHSIRSPTAIALLVLFCALLGAAVWQAWIVREPVYEGKSLRKWLLGYPDPAFGVTGTEDDIQGADAAVRQAGIEAVPTLLRMVQAKDSFLKTKLMVLAGMQHLVRIEFTPDAQLNYSSLHGFEVLGDKAKGAVPALIEIVNRNISPESQYCAVTALGYIGPAAKESVPTLLRCATNANQELRGRAIGALGSVHADAQQVLPVLTRVLSDRDGYTPLHWAAAYGHTEAAELLLTSKAEVNAKTGFGSTPLHLAAECGGLGVAELLLAKGADLNAKDMLGRTPLHAAAEQGQLEVAKLVSSAKFMG